MILGWSLVVRDGPGSAPDVLECLKHPGWFGKLCNPGSIRHHPGVKRVQSVTHPGSPCVVLGRLCLVRGRPGHFEAARFIDGLAPVVRE